MSYLARTVAQIKSQGSNTFYHANRWTYFICQNNWLVIDILDNANHFSIRKTQGRSHTTNNHIYNLIDMQKFYDNMLILLIGTCERHLSISHLPLLLLN